METNTNSPATDDGNSYFDREQEPTVHRTKAALQLHNNSVTGLVVLCQGLKDTTGQDLINIDDDPWKGLPRDQVKPKAKMFRDEVMRRHDALRLNGPKPRPKNWPVEKCQKWLDENPISNAEEIQYLKSKIEEHKQAQEEANTAKQLEMEALERNWVGKYPYLRLVHCIVDDDSIKSAYLRRNDLDNSRVALDSRNSETREPTVFELIADRWNDPLFEPETEAFPDLHPDFMFSERMTFDLVADMAQATSTRVKDKLQSMTVALTRIVSMWERSGQGDGGRITDDDEEDEVRELNHAGFGSLRDRDHGALSSRSSFAPNNQSYLLYYWEVMDKHDLLRNSFQQLNEANSSLDGGPSVPSATSNANDKESKTPAKNAKNFEKLTHSIEELASKNLQAASMAADEQRKDREQRSQAMILELEEKRKDREQRHYIAEADRQYQEKTELKRRLEDLFQEKRKAQRLEAEYTFGDKCNPGMAAYFKREVEQIEKHEKELNQQLQDLKNLQNETNPARQLNL